MRKKERKEKHRKEREVRRTKKINIIWKYIQKSIWKLLNILCFYQIAETLRNMEIKENFDKNLEYFQSPNKNFFGRKMLSSLESCVYWNSYINNLSKSL